ncbi:OsmC family protein [Gracilinema caldarium]|uniref:OsmC family protein n=1 Tax=Gracilinema caldarium (strain ATCC 51460 / DSM 7334 / H1) TaxID=744872 RepID=F8F4D6_GRAC1|nr:OsmC family protein [Gracilinema caldarium]AEJ20583.1 OsmC family protein [Gracilinema caldarium DSM 7334]
MQHEINCTWNNNMSFTAEVGGHKISLDADAAVGGNNTGPTPKPLLLVSLAGCTGMDVISILKKMREPVSYFNVRVQGDLTEEHPKTYTTIKIIYEFKASDGLKDENVRKAISLSQDRYCGVSALLKKALPVEFEVQYI